METSAALATLPPMDSHVDATGRGPGVHPELEGRVLLRRHTQHGREGCWEEREDCSGSHPHGGLGDAVLASDRGASRHHRGGRIPEVDPVCSRRQPHGHIKRARRGRDGRGCRGNKEVLAEHVLARRRVSGSLPESQASAGQRMVEGYVQRAAARSLTLAWSGQPKYMGVMGQTPVACAAAAAE